ncbi:MAG: sodium:solute symporter family protein [Gammaproteobacteria bacterium]|nr:sodium:solute symporter family protein [Gammaproteobacteria bacterium]
MSSKHTHSLDQFSVGRRSFNSFAIFASLSATFIGGGYTLGNAAKVFHLGMFYAFALLGFSLKEILVGLFIAPRMAAYRDCLSIGDIMSRHYGTAAKVITGIFSVLICTGIVGAQVGAIGAIFRAFFHINELWGILIGFAVIIVYSALGGMRAVVYTDILQFLILAVGIPLVFVLGIYYVGGFTAIIHKLPQAHVFFWHDSHTLLPFVFLFITFMLGETLVPPYVQRLLMAKHTWQTRRAIVASGLLSIPFFLIAGGIGLIALLINPQLNANLALPFVVETVLPGFLRGFVIASLLAIIMSSAAGFLNAAAVSLVNDIIKPLKPQIKPMTLLSLAKASVFAIGASSMIFALAIKNVLDILLYAYNFWSPIILVPLLALLFNIKVKSWHFFIGASAGLVGMLVWSFAFEQIYHVSAIIIGILCNLLFFSGAKQCIR